MHSRKAFAAIASCSRVQSLCIQPKSAAIESAYQYPHQYGYDARVHQRVGHAAAAQLHDYAKLCVDDPPTLKSSRPATAGLQSCVVGLPAQGLVPQERKGCKVFACGSTGLRATASTDVAASSAPLRTETHDGSADSGTARAPTSAASAVTDSRHQAGCASTRHGCTSEPARQRIDFAT